MDVSAIKDINCPERLSANLYKNTDKMERRGCNERVKRLRIQFFKNIPNFTVERARIITDVYKRTEGEAQIIRRAKFFAEYCAQKPIVIQQDELIIGSNSPTIRGVNGFPETSINWKDDLRTFATRPIDALLTTPELIEEYENEIFPYWEGRNLRDYCHGHMPDFVKEYIGTEVLDYDIKQAYGYGHCHPGYGTIWIRDGFKGIKERAEKTLESLSYDNPDDLEKIEMLNAAIIVCDAMRVFGERHAYEARKIAENENDPQRKEELFNIADICDRIPWEPPKTFHEALQGIFFCQLGSIMEQSGPACGVGRFDQYMYPFYKKGIEDGILTDEKVLELMECFWIKEAEHIQLHDNGTAEYFGGYEYFLALNIGGIDREGKDAVNELTYMCMQATADIRLQGPTLVARVNRKNPEKYYDEIANLVSMGTGYPQCHNDEVGIQQMLRCGTTVEDAYDYEVEGCTESLINGKMWKYSDAGQINMAAAIELALNRGYCTYGKNAGKFLGVDTGELSEMKTFDDFKKAVLEQIAHLIDIIAIANLYSERAHKYVQTYPYTNCLFEGPLETGTDFANGGALYNTGPSPSCVGLADIANSLAAVKKFVYDEKNMSLDEMAELCRTNFEGKEDFRMMLVKKAPKYGNDDEYVDSLARDVADFLPKEISKHKDFNGCEFISSMYPVASNTPLGKAVGALPSGRKAGVPLADGVSPSQGTDKSPTEVIKSVASYDHVRHLNGNLLNMKFNPQTMEGDLGKKRWVALLKTFFDMGGWHLQCNCVDNEVLKKAQESPEDYPELMVRVAGYSAYFNDLCKETQDEIISRQAHNF